MFLFFFSRMSQSRRLTYKGFSVSLSGFMIENKPPVNIPQSACRNQGIWNMTQGLRNETHLLEANSTYESSRTQTHTSTKQTTYVSCTKRARIEYSNHNEMLGNNKPLQFRRKWVQKNKYLLLPCGKNADILDWMDMYYTISQHSHFNCLPSSI